jgi:L-gulono-1,4-lactone dehydrogenase
MAPIWTNWAGDQRCGPAAIEEPATEVELVDAVGRAAAQGMPARAAGSGHSFTDAACTDGHMLRLGRMRRVLDADPATGLVQVQAGITLHELGRELADRGLAMENQGDIDAQTLAGAISTATHGTGAGFRNLSAQVAGIRLVTADGSVLELSEDSDREAFRAARVGLGCLGVTSAVTLRCVPLFTIHRVDEPRPLAETLAQLDELADGIDHFEFYVFPYADVALTRSSDRSGRSPVPVDPRRLYVQEVLLENRLVDLTARAGRRFPSLIPRINRGVSGLVGRSERTDHSHRVYASRRDVRFTEMEYAIPRAAGAEAVNRVLDLVRRRRLPVGFPIEVRFVAQDDAYLSPSFGRDTCYVACHQYRGMDFESYFRGVEAIMEDYEVRPHWGKRHYRSAATLRPLYPEWDRFQAVRERLDPEGRFGNEYTQRVLGPVGASVAA